MYSSDQMMYHRQCTKRENELPALRSDFIVAFADARSVWLIDNIGIHHRVSVTNDAEAVVPHIVRHWGNHRRIFYRDSEGCWGELHHEGGKFVAFRHGTGGMPIPDLAR